MLQEALRSTQCRLKSHIARDRGCLSKYFLTQKIQIERRGGKDVLVTDYLHLLSNNRDLAWSIDRNLHAVPADVGDVNRNIVADENLLTLATPHDHHDAASSTGSSGCRWEYRMPASIH